MHPNLPPAGVVPEFSFEGRHSRITPDKRQRFTGCAFSVRSERRRGALRASGKAVNQDFGAKSFVPMTEIDILLCEGA